MEAIYPISSLQKDQKALRHAAGKDLVRITENGCAAYVFCSEAVFEERIQQEREDAAYEARVLEAVARGATDIAAGRCCAGDKAIERMQVLRQARG
ncbi:MAG: hypothetical protein RR204_04880 [Raoultibacter sp.]